MLFWIKKMISAFLLPLPFGLLLIMLGLLLLITNQAKRTQITSLISGFCIIFLFSFAPISQGLFNHLQNQYEPLMTVPTQITNIVVLGSGLGGKKNYPPNLTLGPGSLSRLIEGIRVYNMVLKNNPNATLILSGGRVYQSPSVAGKMRNVAVMLGVNPANIALEDGSLDTHDEALFLQKTLGNNPFILVTSAFHMPRSMKLFEALGMRPIAAPTQFSTTGHIPLINYVPNTSNLQKSDTAIHEYLGILWARMRGYIA